MATLSTFDAPGKLAVREALPTVWPGLSVAQLADATGLDKSTVRRWLRTMAADRQVFSIPSGPTGAVAWRRYEDVGPVTPDRPVIGASAPDAQPGQPGPTTPPESDPSDDPQRPVLWWVALRRRRIDHHIPLDSQHTMCNRYMGAGLLLDAQQLEALGSKACPRCTDIAIGGPDGVTPQTDAADTEPASPAAPAASPTSTPTSPAAPDLRAVGEWMGSVRPLAPRAADAPTRPPRRVKADPPVWTVWERGKLTGAIVAWAQDRDGEFGPAECAHALTAQPGSVTYAIGRLVESGHLVRVSESPPRYRAA